MFQLIKLTRPHQWVKNLFVLIPFVFTKSAWSIDNMWLILQAVVVFIGISSAVYVLNDLMDLEKDRLHPLKKNRPLASGAVPLWKAWVLLSVLVLSAALFAWSLHQQMALIVAGYFLLNIAYSLLFKHLIFVDVMLIAMGFVFRVMAGGTASGVIVSEWMLLLVFLFVLFLALSKRRQELKNLMSHSLQTRKVLSLYTIELIDQLNAILVPIIITVYINYTLEQRPENGYFILTIPLVIYCFFRYLFLLKSSAFGEAAKDYLGDKQLIIVGVVWVALALLGVAT